MLNGLIPPRFRPAVPPRLGSGLAHLLEYDHAQALLAVLARQRLRDDVEDQRPAVPGKPQVLAHESAALVNGLVDRNA